MKRKLKSVLALIGALVMTLSMSSFVFAAGDEIILDGDQGASSFIKDWSAKGGEYKYLGFVTSKEATSDYKYLQLTYTGDITYLRIEFNRPDDSNEGPFWFNKDGQTLYFKTVDGSDIPLVAKEATTITLDLSAIGIDMGEFRGMHLHYLDPKMHEGSFSIKNAKLLKSVGGTKSSSSSSDSNSSAGNTNSSSNTNSGSDTNGGNNTGSNDTNSSKSGGSSASGSSTQASGTQGTAGGSTAAPSTGSATYPIAIAVGGILVAGIAFVTSRKFKEEQ